MRLGILQLSDIHFREEHFDPDADSAIAKQICAAVATELIGTTHFVLLMSGDIAFSGVRSEYQYASDWFSELYTLIDDACSATCTFLYAPGNHDVDHTAHRPSRTAIIRQVQNDARFAAHNDIIEECTKEQTEFFAFRNELESRDIQVYDDALLRIHRINHEDATVQINLLNTSWMSELDEQQGSLVFPIERYLNQLTPSQGFALSVLHHPLNWFQPENARRLRDELIRTSSIVCFGHEHMPDNTRGLTPLGDHIRYVDGGVLNPHDKHRSSSFNLILLDTKSEKIRCLTFEKTGQHFAPKRTDSSEWQDATRLLSAESSKFRLSARARRDLEGVGMNVLHPRRDTLRLRDIFVYPDILPLEQRLVRAYEKLERTISSEQLIYDEDNSHVIVEGDEKVGKTAFLRMLFSEFYSRGKIPLLVPAANFQFETPEAIRRSMERVFRDTYEGAEFLQFEQLNSSDRVVLVDDIDFGQWKDVRIETFLEYLLSFCNRAIVSTRSFMSAERVLTGRDQSRILQQYEIYTMQEFGHQRRGELIGKWLQLGQFRQGWDTPAILEEREIARVTVDTIIGRNFVPSTPMFVLVILQSISSAASNLIGSTYGDYYQFLITRSMIHAGIRPEDLDAYSNYLSELAYRMFDNGKVLGSSEYSRWHDDFCKDYAIEWRYSDTKLLLERAGVLEEGPVSSVSFRFPYVYYFFLARFISRNLSDDEMRDRVDHMCRRLHVTDFANVILFIIHHSDNSFVLDTIRSATASLMIDQSQFSFEVSDGNELLATVNALPSSAERQTLEDRDPEKEQERELREKDVLDAEREDVDEEETEVARPPETPMEALDVLAQAGIAAKSVDLLGQVLKNYYGSLRVSTKMDIAEEAVKVGLRALWSYLDLCLAEEKNFVELLSEARRDYEVENLGESERSSEKERKRWAREVVFSFARSISRAIILRVSRTVSARQLRPTLAKLVEKNASVAYKFVELSVLLDTPGDIPREQIDGMAKELQNNLLGVQVLRDLVARRVYRFPTDYRDKQWLAEKLGFSIRKQRYVDRDQTRRVLPR